MSTRDLRRDAAALWSRGRAAFDSRAPRERALLAAALAAAVLMLADAAWITPAAKAWSLARQQHRQVQAALASARAELRRAESGGLDPVRQLEQEIGQTRERVGALDRDLAEQTAGLVGAERMVSVLEQMLAHQPQVRVRQLQSLPRTDLLAAGLPGAAASASAPGKPSAAPGAAALYRHGVELTLEGGYLELLGYLRALDAQPQQLLAGGLQFRVEKHPASTLTLRLYTLSMDRHWLEI